MAFPGPKLPEEETHSASRSLKSKSSINPSFIVTKGLDFYYFFYGIKIHDPEKKVSKGELLHKRFQRDTFITEVLTALLSLRLPVCCLSSAGIC